MRLYSLSYKIQLCAQIRLKITIIRRELIVDYHQISVSSVLHTFSDFHFSRPLHKSFCPCVFLVYAPLQFSLGLPQFANSTLLGGFYIQLFANQPCQIYCSFLTYPSIHYRSSYNFWHLSHLEPEASVVPRYSRNFSELIFCRKQGAGLLSQLQPAGPGFVIKVNSPRQGSFFTTCPKNCEQKIIPYPSKT